MVVFAPEQRRNVVKLTRPKAIFLAAGITVVGAAGTIAIASAANLPILGFGDDASPVAAAPRLEPIVVEVVEYDDIYTYVTRPATAPDSKPADPATGPAAGLPAAPRGAGSASNPPLTTGAVAPTRAASTSATPAPAPTVASPAPESAPASTTTRTATSTARPATTSTRPATTTRSASTTTRDSATTTRPSPPSGCEEPEWDREHQSWHCKGD